MSRKIIICGADKGGVGKTTTCRALLAWDKAQGARVLDGDGNLSKFKCISDPEPLRVDLGTVPDQMVLLDVRSDLTVVDVGAGQLSKLLRVLRDAGYLDEDGISITVLHVVGPNTMSMDEIPAVHSQLERHRHVVVKCCAQEGARFFDFQPDVAAALSFDDARNVITVPHLEEYVQENVDLAALGYKAFVESPRQSDLQKRKVRHWLKLVHAELARGEVL